MNDNLNNTYNNNEGNDTTTPSDTQQQYQQPQQSNGTEVTAQQAINDMQGGEETNSQNAQPVDFSKTIFSSSQNEQRETPNTAFAFVDSQPKTENPPQAEQRSSIEWDGTGTQPMYGNQTPKYNYSSTQPYGASPKKEKKKMGRGGFVAICLVCSIIISVICGTGGAMLISKVTNNSTSSGGVTINQVEKASGSATEKTGNALTTEEITSAVADSVVEITTESVSTGSFYQQYITEGAGSGVIFSVKDNYGYIMTNNHVISGASKITVTLRDGTDFSGTLVGADEEQDIAIVKIKPGDTELTTATFGDSDDINVGEKAVVIGNPLGRLGGTVTEGIVSALDRSLTVENQVMNLMQVDAAINPGNSGGGVFNEYGELIGIVVAKASSSSTGSSESVEGLGFAIPINDALDIVNDLIDYGYVRGKVNLGITMLDITSESQAMMYGLSETGVYVYSVEDNSPAATANMQNGDRIISIDGTKVTSSAQVKKILNKSSVGDKVTIKVERNGQTGNLTVTLAEDIPETIESTTDAFSATQSTEPATNGNSFWSQFFG